MAHTASDVHAKVATASRRKALVKYIPILTHLYNSDEQSERESDFLLQLNETFFVIELIKGQIPAGHIASSVL